MTTETTTRCDRPKCDNTDEDVAWFVELSLKTIDTIGYSSLNVQHICEECAGQMGIETQPFPAGNW